MTTDRERSAIDDSTTVPSEKSVRRFVLGRLHEEDIEAAEILEDRVFADEAFAELVHAVEEELIDDFARGLLSPEDEHRFETRLSQIDPSHERLAFARSLVTEQTGVLVGGLGASGSRVPSLWQVLPMAAALVLAFWGSYLLTGQRSVGDVENRLRLDAVQWRSGGELPVIERTATGSAEVTLDLSSNDFSAYRVELADPDGTVLHQWDGLLAEETDDTISIQVDIPLAGMTEGDFTLDVLGLTEQTAELLERFPFRYRP